MAMQTMTINSPQAWGEAFHIILLIPQNQFYEVGALSHSMEGQTETWPGEMSCPRPRNSGAELEPESPSSKFHFHCTVFNICWP